MKIKWKRFLAAILAACLIFGDSALVYATESAAVVDAETAEDILEEKTEAVSEEGAAAGEDAEAVPEEGAAAGEDAEAVPEEEAAAGEDAEAVPEEETAAGEDAEAVPEEETAVEEDAEAVPEEEAAAEEDAEALPEEEEFLETQDTELVLDVEVNYSGNGYYEYTPTESGYYFIDSEDAYTKTLSQWVWPENSSKPYWRVVANVDSKVMSDVDVFLVGKTNADSPSDVEWAFYLEAGERYQFRVYGYSYHTFTFRKATEESMPVELKFDGTSHKLSANKVIVYKISADEFKTGKLDFFATEEEEMNISWRHHYVGEDGMRYINRFPYSDPAGDGLIAISAGETYYLAILSEYETTFSLEDVSPLNTPLNRPVHFMGIETYMILEYDFETAHELHIRDFGTESTIVCVDKDGKIISNNELSDLSNQVYWGPCDTKPATKTYPRYTYIDSDERIDKVVVLANSTKELGDVTFTEKAGSGEAVELKDWNGIYQLEPYKKGVFSYSGKNYGEYYILIQNDSSYSDWTSAVKNRTMSYMPGGSNGYFQIGNTKYGGFLYNYKAIRGEFTFPEKNKIIFETDLKAYSSDVSVKLLTNEDLPALQLIENQDVIPSKNSYVGRSGNSLYYYDLYEFTPETTGIYKCNNSYMLSWFYEKESGKYLYFNKNEEVLEAGTTYCMRINHSGDKTAFSIYKDGSVIEVSGKEVKLDDPTATYVFRPTTTGYFGGVPNNFKIQDGNGSWKTYTGSDYYFMEYGNAYMIRVDQPITFGCLKTFYVMDWSNYKELTSKGGNLEINALGQWVPTNVPNGFKVNLSTISFMEPVKYGEMDSQQYQKLIKEWTGNDGLTLTGIVDGFGNDASDVKAADGKIIFLKYAPKYVWVGAINASISQNRLPVGGTAKISVNPTPENLKYEFREEPEITYVSYNPSVATVDANGNVKAVGVGTADIYIKADETLKLQYGLWDQIVTEKITITVKEANDASLGINSINVSMKSGNEIIQPGVVEDYAKSFVFAKSAAARTYTLEAEAFDGDGYPVAVDSKNLKWKSSNTKLASVKVLSDGTAALTILKNAEGNVKITATAANNKTIVYSINLSMVDTGVRLETTSLTLNSWKNEWSYIKLYPNTSAQTLYAGMEHSAKVELVDRVKVGKTYEYVEAGEDNVFILGDYEFDKGNLQIRTREAQPKGKTYTVYLRVTQYFGETALESEVVSVKVTDKITVPKATGKASKPYEHKYIGDASYAELILTTNEKIEFVETKVGTELGIGTEADSPFMVKDSKLLDAENGSYKYLVRLRVLDEKVLPKENKSKKVSVKLMLSYEGYTRECAVTVSNVEISNKVPTIKQYPNMEKSIGYMTDINVKEMNVFFTIPHVLYDDHSNVTLQDGNADINGTSIRLIGKNAADFEIVQAEFAANGATLSSKGEVIPYENVLCVTVRVKAGVKGTKNVQFEVFNEEHMKSPVTTNALKATGTTVSKATNWLYETLYGNKLKTITFNEELVGRERTTAVIYIPDSISKAIEKGLIIPEVSVIGSNKATIVKIEEGAICIEPTGRFSHNLETYSISLNKEAFVKKTNTYGLKFVVTLNDGVNKPVSMKAMALSIKANKTVKPTVKLTAKGSLNVADPNAQLLINATVKDLPQGSYVSNIRFADEKYAEMFEFINLPDSLGFRLQKRPGAEVKTGAYKNVVIAYDYMLGSQMGTVEAKVTFNVTQSVSVKANQKSITLYKSVTGPSYGKEVVISETKFGAAISNADVQTNLEVYGISHQIRYTEDGEVVVMFYADSSMDAAVKTKTYPVTIRVFLDDAGINPKTGNPYFYDVKFNIVLKK